jgi:hypothetical protein
MDLANIRTVTVQRTAVGRGIIDLTVVLNETCEIVEALDEDGTPTTLSANETLLAQCLARNGVDETGR